MNKRVTDSKNDSAYVNAAQTAVDNINGLSQQVHTETVALEIDGQLTNVQIVVTIGEYEVHVVAFAGDKLVHTQWVCIGELR